MAGCSILKLSSHEQTLVLHCVSLLSALQDALVAPGLCRDGVILACEILDCCPWFEFADLDVYVSDEDDEEDDEDVEVRRPCKHAKLFVLM